ncbi:hypothetical protein FRB90_006955, partial [Tulasnella sp. 427]
SLILRRDEAIRGEVSYQAYLLDACREVIGSMESAGPTEWSFLRTWLALWLDPITLHYSQKVLEEAFVEVSRGAAGHPILKDPDHILRCQGPDEVKARGSSASLTCYALDLFKSLSLRDFIEKHSSEEVSYTLHQYLPLPIRTALYEMLLKEGMLSGFLKPENELPSSFDEAAKGFGVHEKPLNSVSVTVKQEEEDPPHEAHPHNTYGPPGFPNSGPSRARIINAFGLSSNPAYPDSSKEQLYSAMEIDEPARNFEPPADRPGPSRESNQTLPQSSFSYSQGKATELMRGASVYVLDDLDDVEMADGEQGCSHLDRAVP